MRCTRKTHIFSIKLIEFYNFHAYKITLEAEFIVFVIEN